MGGRYQSAYRQEGTLEKVVNNVKSYRGSVIPIIGGCLAAGAFGVTAFAVGAAWHAMDTLSYFQQTGSIPETIKYLVDRASYTAGKACLGGYAFGHLLTYGVERTISKIVNKILRGR